MNPHLFLAYCFAVAILVLMPGPIVTLVVAHSLRHGSRSGLATVAGASIGNGILLGATAIGLVAFSAWARGWFTAPARQRLQNRLTGTLLIGIGCGLIFAHRGN